MNISYYIKGVFSLSFLFMLECFAFDYEFVTCGSALKLSNDVYGVRLHSHDVKYGSGSGQQSVTGMSDELDANSFWQIRGSMKKDCTRGSPIKCGQTIRLMHLTTKKNLHSHHFQSPMSNEQEVSAFGDEGVGDKLDEWVVQCNGKNWSRNEKIRFKHKETQAYLSCSAKTYGRPINGQQEIVATGQPTRASNYWKAAEGVFIKPSDSMGEKQQARKSVEEDSETDEDDSPDVVVDDDVIEVTHDHVTITEDYDNPVTSFLTFVFDYFSYMFNWVKSILDAYFISAKEELQIFVFNFLRCCHWLRLLAHLTEC